MSITVEPLTNERWMDLEAVFNAKGCSFARGCWCMCYRETGKPKVPDGVVLADHLRMRFKKIVTAGPPPGLLAYRDDGPVGWVAVGPREDYLKLRRSPVMKPVDDKPVWSVICFVVPSPYRHQGIASALLAGAIAHARRQGASILEAYPIDKANRGADNWLWHGAKSMYDKVGFIEVVRRKPARPVVRLTL